MFGKDNVMGSLLFDSQGTQMIIDRSIRPVFAEFEGASASMDDDGRLEYTPRGKIYINVNSIGGFYDHRILLLGNKIHVMETNEQIRQRILEALK